MNGTTAESSYRMNERQKLKLHERMRSFGTEIFFLILSKWCFCSKCNCQVKRHFDRDFSSELHFDSAQGKVLYAYVTLCKRLQFFLKKAFHIL